MIFRDTLHNLLHIEKFLSSIVEGADHQAATNQTPRYQYFAKHTSSTGNYMTSHSGG